MISFRVSDKEKKEVCIMYQPFKKLKQLIADKHLKEMRQSVEKFLQEVETNDPYSEDTVALLDELKKARRGLQVNFINY